MSEEVSDMMGRSKHGAHSQDTCKCPHCEKNLSLNNNFVRAVAGHQEKQKESIKILV